MSPESQSSARSPEDPINGETVTDLISNENFAINPYDPTRLEFQAATNSSRPGPNGEFIDSKTEHINIDAGGNRIDHKRLIGMSCGGHAVHMASADGKQPGDLHGFCISVFHFHRRNPGQRMVKHGYDGICDDQGGAVCEECRADRATAIAIFLLLSCAVIIGLFCGLMD